MYLIDFILYPFYNKQVVKTRKKLFMPKGYQIKVPVISLNRLFIELVELKKEELFIGE